MLCGKSSVNSGAGSAAVYLNVYDLTAINGYAYWLGLGVYHSGVQGLLPSFLSVSLCYFSLVPISKQCFISKQIWIEDEKAKSDLNFGWKKNLAVHGVEYAFGAHEQATTGIFEGEPRKCEGFTFRKSILIGWSEMSGAQVRGLMEQLAEKYRGNAYNLITKNCNHFCNDACIQLTGNPIPNWVNRLARIGESSDELMRLL